MVALEKGGRVEPVSFAYHTIRTVTSPEDNKAGRRHYAGVAPANSFFSLNTNENVRDYLGRDEEGGRRKPTKVNAKILDTLSTKRDEFSILNSGIVIVAREALVDDNAKPKKADLYSPSIINGSQTQGILKDFFTTHKNDVDYPSVNFELIVTDDEALIAAVSIARNFQNDVDNLSIYGRLGRFKCLEEAMKRRDPTISLRTSESDFSDALLDTEKLIQVVTAMAPQGIPLPSAEKRPEKTPETIYRVYAYRHRSRCLQDFAAVMEKPQNWPIAKNFFLDVAFEAWQLYRGLKGEQAFSRLQNVKGETVNNRKMVDSDGVPDGIVFPMLSALSRFMRLKNGHWLLDIPEQFPWSVFFNQAMQQETGPAANNPNTMGKKADCYIALHGALEMFLARP